MMWLSHPKHRHYTGSWQGGVIEGFGEMIYSDHSVYTGWWHMGMRHRHGRMEYRRDNSTYTGGWETELGIIALILIGYPLLFAFTLGVFEFAKRRSNRAWLAAAIACLVLAAWNELPNLLVPMWTITEPHRGFASWLLPAGYPLETPVAAYELPP